jgi:hypothetical protein
MKPNAQNTQFPSEPDSDSEKGRDEHTQKESISLDPRKKYFDIDDRDIAPKNTHILKDARGIWAVRVWELGGDQESFGELLEVLPLDQTAQHRT